MEFTIVHKRLFILLQQNANFNSYSKKVIRYFPAKEKIQSCTKVAIQVFTTKYEVQN